MKTVVVANPRAGAGRVHRLWDHYNRIIVEHFGPSEVRFTDEPQQATAVVRSAIENGAERIVVVGGDGTINEAVNGFFSADAAKPLGDEVSLVVYPVGTGSDFARSIGLSRVDMSQALRTAEDRRIDVGRATLMGPEGRAAIRHFINISSFGSSGMVVDKVNRTPKVLGSKLSFMLGTIRGMLSYTNQRVRLQVDDCFDEEVIINTVAVANGRYFGGSMKVAPKARLNDGLFDVVVMGDVGLSTFLRYGRHIYRGTHLGLPEVRLFHGRKVVATPLGTEHVFIDLDGEQPGTLPVTYEVVPAAIKLFAPWGAAEAVAAA